MEFLFFPFSPDLISAGLLEDESQLSDLETLLTLLPAPQIRALAKEMSVLPSQGGSKTKSDFVRGFLAHARKKSLFGSTQSVESRVRKRARALLGPCFRLSGPPRVVFRR